MSGSNGNGRADGTDGGAEILQFPDQGTLIADFRAVFQKMQVNRAGALVLTFLVPLDHKYDALPITDFPGMVLRMSAKREVIVYSDAIVAELKVLGIDEFRTDDHDG